MPEVPLRENALGVNAWGDTAPVITSHRAPGQGRFSVADPRPVQGWHNEALGVRGWRDTGRVVAGASRPLNGAHSVADPRPQQANQTFQQYGVQRWDENAVAVSGQSSPGGGPYSVADPRVDGHPRSVQLGVRSWNKPTGVVKGKMDAGQGPYAVSDPRLNRTAHSNVYRIIPFDQATISITSSRDVAVADPRHGSKDYTTTKYKVTPFDGASRAVIGASTTGDGAFAVADPRPACLNNPERDGYSTQGHYGVTCWDQPSNAIPGHAKNNNGKWSVADPREGFSASTEEPVLPKPEDRLVCRIIATDGTWHRPFTTLDLASLQSLFDPEELFYFEDGVWRCREAFDLIGGSDVTKREWIGNAVPGAAATGMAIGETILLAEQEETFFLSSREIWVKPAALALAVNNDQAAFAMDAGRERACAAAERSGKSGRCLTQIRSSSSAPEQAGKRACQSVMN